MDDINPRMSEAEITLFRGSLAGKRSYLEFGCGGSTMAVLDSPIRTITSIESDRAWIDKLRTVGKVTEAEKTGRLKFHHVDLGPLTGWGVPENDSKIRNWPAYYGNIWKNADHVFDIILIDGRFRTACALMAVNFVHPDTTVLIHDYINRPGYYVVERYYDTVGVKDTMVSLRRRPNFNFKAWTLDLIANIHNPS
jgi:hypothetical protein